MSGLGVWFLASLWLNPTAEDFLAQVGLIKERHTNVLVVAVLYNKKTHAELAVPSRVDSVRMVEVPISSIRDLSHGLVHGVLKKAPIQALYLVDDDGGLVTNKKTMKYLQKLAKKHNFKIFSNIGQSHPGLSGRFVVQDGKTALVENEN